MILASTTNTPPRLLTSLRTLYQQILTLLRPLLAKPVPGLYDRPPEQCIELMSILFLATRIHIDGKVDTEQILYYVPAPALGGRWDEQDMETIGNRDSDILSDDDGVRLGGEENVELERDILVGMKKRVVVVSGWPGCVSYRKKYAIKAGKKTEIGTVTRVVGRAGVVLGTEIIIPGEDEGGWAAGSEGGRKGREVGWNRRSVLEKRRKGLSKKGVAVAVAAGVVWGVNKGWVMERVWKLVEDRRWGKEMFG